MSKLAPDSVVTYLFHECGHSHSVIFCLVWHVHGIFEGYNVVSVRQI